MRARHAPAPASTDYDLFMRETPLRLCSLCQDPGTFRSGRGIAIRGRSCQRYTPYDGAMGQEKAFSEVSVHVSPVSTILRSFDKNPTDCISTNLDTVRGNSCASGPSVYKASGETAADMMSLTRLS